MERVSELAFADVAVVALGKQQNIRKSCGLARARKHEENEDLSGCSSMVERQPSKLVTE